MLDTTNSWELFGFDVRRIGKHWSSAWTQFLWEHDSPVRAHLDETVLLHSEGAESAYYHGNRRLTGAVNSRCEAVLLPDNAVLSKTLHLPLAAEADLDAVMALEVSAHSPFPSDDTGFGWALLGHGDSSLQVQLVLVSLSATMSYLGQVYDCHDPKVYEVWAETNSTFIVIQGFGEAHRHALYRRRLLRVGGLIACCAVAALLMFGLASITKYFELQGYQEMAARVETRSVTAAELRASLALGNETVHAVNTYVDQHPNPHLELARLTRLLGDDAFVEQFSMAGRSIRLRGQARDAAEVMSKLTEEPAYTEVTAPQAITKLGNSGKERFVLTIQLAETAS